MKQKQWKTIIILSILYIFFAVDIVYSIEIEENKSEFNSTNLRKSCLNIERSVCIGKEQKEIGLQGIEENLKGHWKFDDQFGIDHTPQQNDIIQVPKVGPQQGGQGSSAYFDDSYMSEIQHIKEYSNQEFSISFWIFLVQHQQGQGWKTILQKGNNSQELTPTISLWPNENRINLKVSTDFEWNENLDSKSGLVSKRWSHLTFTFTNMLVQIYINGQLDNQLLLTGQLKHNQGNFHIGKDPWHQGPIFYMDDLRIYDKILRKHEIQSISHFQSVFSGDSYAVLGCESCNYQRAVVSCPEQYHLCSFPEIYAGAYQIARSMGWFRASPYFWVKKEESEILSEQIYDQELFDPNVFKVGICCMNNNYN